MIVHVNSLGKFDAGVFGALFAFAFGGRRYWPGGGVVVTLAASPKQHKHDNDDDDTRDHHADRDVRHRGFSRGEGGLGGMGNRKGSGQEENKKMDGNRWKLGPQKHKIHVKTEEPIKVCTWDGWKYFLVPSSNGSWHSPLFALGSSLMMILMLQAFGSPPRKSMLALEWSTLHKRHKGKRRWKYNALSVIFGCNRRTVGWLSCRPKTEVKRRQKKEKDPSH